MPITRKIALKRLQGLADVVELHLEKIASEPDGESTPHHRSEVRGWLTQMKAMLPHIGQKTAADWSSRLSTYESTLEDLDNE